MKKRILLIFLLLLGSPSISKALEVTTHRAINEFIARRDINNFSLVDYLNEYLGFSKGVEEIIDTKKVFAWLGDGGENEDDPIRRAANHFHDPVSNKGWGWGISAIDWALLPYNQQSPGGYYSWASVRQDFFLALTFSSDTKVRGKWFAETFRGLGQLMHLVQDMSVPEHTRNDFHNPSYYERWVLHQYNPGSTEPIDNNLLKTPGTASRLPIANLFDTDTYKGNNPQDTVSNKIGLAEYTNANFLTPDTMFTGYNYPSEKTSVTLYNSTIDDPRDPSSPVKVVRQYYQKAADGDTGYLLANVSFATQYDIYDKVRNKSISLDDLVFRAYADRLMPKAIGYSAEILRYFFRGTLEVTENAIIAGNSYGINKIKAKVVNTTPNNEAMPKGEIFAFARYKTNPDVENFSYAVCGPGTDKDGAAIKSINYGTPEDIFFDFSGNTIPADVKELYLDVVYNGTLGNEQDTGIAVSKPVEVKKEYALIRISGQGVNKAFVWDILKNNYADIKKPDGTLITSPCDLQELDAWRNTVTNVETEELYERVPVSPDRELGCDPTIIGLDDNVKCQDVVGVQFFNYSGQEKRSYSSSKSDTSFSRLIEVTDNIQDIVY